MRTEQLLKWLLKNFWAILVVFVVVIWVASLVLQPYKYQWASAEQSVNGLLNDVEYGFRAIPTAIQHGDKAVELLREQSAGYSKISQRNASWIEQVLSSHQTPATLQIADELSRQSGATQKLLGEVVLAKMGKLGDPSPLVANCTTRPAEDPNNELLLLAVRGLGYCKRQSDVPTLEMVIKTHSSDAWIMNEVCRSLASIGGQSAISLLEASLHNSDFAAPASAYRALIALGSKQATPLAISRVSSDGSWMSDDLVTELQARTGQHFGHDKGAWQRWEQTSNQTSSP